MIQRTGKKADCLPTKSIKKNPLRAWAVMLPILGFLSCSPTSGDKDFSDREWREYLGGPDRNHYSVLDQINADNVHQLEVAWTYHTLDTGQIQCNPIIVEGVLYGMTASTQPFAVNAATGEEYWRKTADEGEDQLATSRGLVYWEDGDDKRIL